MTETLINIVLFVMMIATAIAILRMQRLFAVVMLSGVFSLLSALLFVALDAVDVAFTEAAVGAGITTVLMLGTMALTAREEKLRRNFTPIPLIVVLLTGVVLIYGTLDMPHFGAADSPAQTYLADTLMRDSVEDMAIPNAVTSILASYRGYDTLGEAVVVFTACIGVLMLIGSFATRRRSYNVKRDRGPRS